MPAGKRPVLAPRAAPEGTMAVVHCGEPFLLDPGHRLRAAPCLVCRKAIGAQAATVIGVAPLAGAACECGALTSDVFLVHYSHLPIRSPQLARAIAAAVQCPRDHSSP